MDRLERLRTVIDDVLGQQPDLEVRRCGFVHLYGVAAACALLALSRGEDVELAVTAGMLHDLDTYRSGEGRNHGPRSAVLAEQLLGELGDYDADEIGCISHAIALHSAKGQVDGPLDELLKDADVLQHYLYNPTLKPTWKTDLRSEARLERVRAELGIATDGS